MNTEDIKKVIQGFQKEFEKGLENLISITSSLEWIITNKAL